MKLGEFKNARNITNSILNIVEKSDLELVSMNFVDIDDGKIRINFIVKTNNFDKTKLTSKIEKEFRYNDWGDNFEITQYNNYTDVLFNIK